MAIVCNPNAYPVNMDDITEPAPVVGASSILEERAVSHYLPDGVLVVELGGELTRYVNSEPAPDAAPKG